MTTTQQAATIQPDDVRKLRHMLGATERYRPSQWGFRNYYATSGGESMEAMDRLVAAGLAVKGASSTHMTYYHATAEGVAMLGFTKAQTKRAFQD